MTEGFKPNILETKEKVLPKYDAILIHGGNIRRTNKGFSSTNFHEGPEKSIGAHSRSRAASELFKKGEANLFIVSTGKTHPDSDAPTEAQVMKDELMRFGVPEDKIIKEEVSLTTLTNLEEVIKIIKQLGLKNIGILSSSWHLARIKAMYDSFKLKDDDIKTTFLSSEKILLDKSKRFLPLIERVYNRQSMKERILKEQQGMKDFKEGKYKSKPIEYNPLDNK